MVSMVHRLPTLYLVSIVHSLPTLYLVSMGWFQRGKGGYETELTARVLRRKKNPKHTRD